MVAYFKRFLCTYVLFSNMFKCTPQRLSLPENHHVSPEETLITTLTPQHFSEVKIFMKTTEKIRKLSKEHFYSFVPEFSLKGNYV